MEFLFKHVVIPFVVFWLLGYWLHKRMKSDVSDIRLPWIIQLFFGIPRSDDTLSTAGITLQLLGYLYGATGVMVALGVIGKEAANYTVGGGGMLLSIWFIWTLKSEQKITVSKPPIGPENIGEDNQWRIANTIKGEILPKIRTQRNWWVVVFISITFLSIVIMALWMMWILSVTLLPKMSTGQASSNAALFISIVMIGILAIVGIAFAIFPMLYLLDVRFRSEGIRVLTLTGYRFVRWSDIVEIQIRGRDTIILETGEQSIPILLLSFQSPQEIIGEIQKRVSGNNFGDSNSIA